MLIKEFFLCASEPPRGAYFSRRLCYCGLQLLFAILKTSAIQRTFFALTLRQLACMDNWIFGIVAFFIWIALKRGARAREKAPRALNEASASFICFCKLILKELARVRELWRVGSCVGKATAKLKSQTIHFQKNDFCRPPNPKPKIIFLRRGNGNLIILYHHEKCYHFKNVPDYKSLGAPKYARPHPNFFKT